MRAVGQATMRTGVMRQGGVYDMQVCPLPSGTGNHEDVYVNEKPGGFAHELKAPLPCAHS